MTNTSKRLVREAFGRAPQGWQWFPAEKEELSIMVAGFIKKAAASNVPGRIVGAIAPHAGYSICGRISGYTFRAIRDNAVGTNAPETAVIVGFTHSMGYRGIALMDGDAVKTPLGETELDRSASETLMKGRDRILRDYRPHNGEHSAANEIPFVQTALPGAKLVVALFGDHDEDSVTEFVAALNDLAKTRRILVVASTDMLHADDRDLVMRTDADTLRKIATMDFKGLMREWGLEHQTVCGMMPVQAVIRFAQAQGAREGKVLKTGNSGDEGYRPGQYCVGYSSVIFTVP